MDPRYLIGTPLNGVQPVRPSDINGRKLSRALKAGKLPSDWRARLALRLQEGAVFLHHLTARQARLLTGAKVGDVAAARRVERPKRQRYRQPQAGVVSQQPDRQRRRRHRRPSRYRTADGRARSGHQAAMRTDQRDVRHFGPLSWDYGGAREGAALFSNRFPRKAL